MPSHRSASPVLLLLRLEPPWAFVDELRRFVESFCATACPAAGRQEDLALATHELVQNAIANNAGREVEVRLEVDAGARRVGVAVSNRVRPGQLEDLLARVTRLYAQQDPLAAYVSTLREAEVTARGGLGLARVRYESALDLEVTSEGDWLTVHASGPLDGTPVRLAS